MLMTRSKTSKDSFRGFQVSSEISFLISARKALPTSGQTIDVTFEPKIFTKGPFSSQKFSPKNFQLPFEHMYEALNVIK